MSSPRPRVAVLISGSGTNMEVILASRATMDATFVGCISSRADAAGIERAQRHGLDVRVIPAASHPDRAAYDAALQATLDELGATFVVLAGFMRILTDSFVARWRGRMVNIHPSLLPAFPGLHAQRQALEAGVRVAGCTVHFVEPGEVDGGPIIAQAAVPVFDDDTEESLSARIQREEHRIYPAALARLFDGRLRYVDGAVVAGGRADHVPVVGS